MVDVEVRLDVLKLTGKPPIIYHAFNVTNEDATVNIQIQPLKNATVVLSTRLFIMLRKEKLPTLTSCDMIKSVASITHMDGMYIVHYNYLFLHNTILFEKPAIRH